MDILGKFDFLTNSATETFTKIEKLSKIMVGANVSIKDIFFAKAIRENIPEGGRMAMINTIALLDKESDGRRFIKFKAALGQSFPSPSTHSTFAARSFELQNPSSRSRDPQKGRQNRPRGDSNRNKSPNFNRNRRKSDPGTPDPTLVNDASAMTAVQTGQALPQLVFTLAAPI